MWKKLSELWHRPALRPWEHLVAVFLVTDGATMWWNGRHVFAERGLDGLKAQAFSLLVAGAIACGRITV